MTRSLPRNPRNMFKSRKPRNPCAPSDAREMKCSGFTLIEVVVVLFLIALLASLVAVSASGMVRGATLEEVVAQIGSLDQEARRASKRLGHTVTLHIDAEDRRLTIRDPQAPDDPPLGGLSIPNAFEITEALRLNQGELVGGSNRVIQYEPDGTCMTWALTLSDRHSGEQLNTTLLLGMTGQMTQWQDNGQAQDILAETLGRHPD